MAGTQKEKRVLSKVRFEIEPEKTALIIVDMQNSFLLPGSPGETPDGLKIIPNIRRLADACRSNKIPVIYIRHILRRDGSDMGILRDIFGDLRKNDGIIEGSKGSEIHSDLAPKVGDILVKKLRFSGFQGTELEAILRSLGVDTVMITGVTTETCCETTARDAMHREFKMIFVSDATAAHDFPDIGFGPVSHEEVQKVTCTILGTKFGMVARTEELLETIQK